MKVRQMLRVLVSQIRIIPSSDPETSKIPSIANAKQVTALLFQEIDHKFFKENKITKLEWQ